MEPKFFVGVDLSKLTMDLALLHANYPVRSFKINNTEDSFKDFLKELKAEYGFKAREVFFCAENMGVYATNLTKVLSSKKIDVCLESPLQIKKSLGIQRGKNDKLDAIRIAGYAKKNYNTLSVWGPPRECIDKLKKLTTLRRRLVKIRTMLINEEKVKSYFLTAEVNKGFNQYYESSLNSINQDIGGIDKAISETVFADEHLTRLTNLITSVPCAGQVLAFQIIISTNEFQTISSAKKFASYCGVAPFEWSSGSSISRKRKVSGYADKEIKATLHLAAMRCLQQKDSELRLYYLRKQKEGKNNMSILNAVRNKILHRIFACVNSDRLFQSHGLM
jgi:transposase